MVLSRRASVLHPSQEGHKTSYEAET